MSEMFPGPDPRPCPVCGSRRLRLRATQEVILTVNVDMEPTKPGCYTIFRQDTDETTIHEIQCRACLTIFPEEPLPHADMPGL